MFLTGCDGRKVALCLFHPFSPVWNHPGWWQLLPGLCIHTHTNSRLPRLVPTAVFIALFASFALIVLTGNQTPNADDGVLMLVNQCFVFPVFSFSSFYFSDCLTVFFAFALSLVSVFVLLSVSLSLILVLFWR